MRYSVVRLVSSVVIRLRCSLRWLYLVHDCVRYALFGCAARFVHRYSVALLASSIVIRLRCFLRWLHLAMKVTNYVIVDWLFSLFP